jgi:hypothetical protein
MIFFKAVFRLNGLGHRAAVEADTKASERHSAAIWTVQSSTLSIDGEKHAIPNTTTLRHFP